MATITTRPARHSKGIWYRGTITHNGTTFHYLAAIYDESMYGIKLDGVTPSRVSKLFINNPSQTEVFQYDRDWNEDLTARYQEDILELVRLLVEHLQQRVPVGS